jgi:hypothetical protein
VTYLLPLSTEKRKSLLLLPISLKFSLRKKQKITINYSMVFQSVILIPWKSERREESLGCGIRAVIEILNNESQT